MPRVTPTCLIKNSFFPYFLFQSWRFSLSPPRAETRGSLHQNVGFVRTNFCLHIRAASLLTPKWVQIGFPLCKLINVQPVANGLA